MSELKLRGFKAVSAVWGFLMLVLVGVLGGIGGILGIIFIVLKLTQDIDWRWIWVVSPFWLGAGALVLGLIAIFVPSILEVKKQIKTRSWF